MLMNIMNTITKLTPYIKVASMLFLKNSICLYTGLHQTEKKISSIWHSLERPSNRAGHYVITGSRRLQICQWVISKFRVIKSASGVRFDHAWLWREQVCSGNIIKDPIEAEKPQKVFRKQLFFIKEITDHLHGRRKDETNKT